MDELEAKVVEVNVECNQTIVALTVYTNEVLERTRQFMNADLESISTLDDSMKLLLTELSEVIRKCKSIRNTIENKSSPAANSSSELLIEVNPSIVDGYDTIDTLSNEDDEAHQTTLKIPNVAPFSGDDHPGNLPPYKASLEADSDSASTQAECDNPPPYAELAVTPGYPKGDFDFSLGQAFCNLFSVKLSHKNELKMNVKTRIDNVLSVFFPSAAFKQEDASFKPPCDGVYAINVEVCQYGNGQMDVWLCRRGHVSYVGKTNGNMLETSVMKVKMLTEGQDLWVEVRALKGHPFVYWCNFSGFLIAKKPSTGIAAASV